jgi:predicted nucleic acid binding AN1-type Zn finger protein
MEVDLFFTFWGLSALRDPKKKPKKEKKVPKTNAASKVKKVTKTAVEPKKVEKAETVKPVAARAKGSAEGGSQPEKLRKELLEKIVSETDSGSVDEFYISIKGNLNALDFVSQGYKSRDISKSDLKKCKMIVSDILTSSHLKNLKDIRQIVEQVFQCLDLLESNFEQYESKFLNDKIKVLLNYIEKIDKFTRYDTIFSAINEVGSIFYQIKSKKKTKTNSRDDQLELIRKKLAQKDILKSKIAMKSLVGTPDK